MKMEVLSCVPALQSSPCVYPTESCMRVHYRVVHHALAPLKGRMHFLYCCHTNSLSFSLSRESLSFSLSRALHARALHGPC